MVLLDYLKWRNDVNFSVASFNDIDNVILSYLSYMDFGELFQEHDKIYSIEEAFDLFCEKHSLEDIRKNGQFTIHIFFVNILSISLFILNKF